MAIAVPYLGAEGRQGVKVAREDSVNSCLVPGHLGGVITLESAGCSGQHFNFIHLGYFSRRGWGGGEFSNILVVMGEERFGAVAGVKFSR